MSNKLKIILGVIALAIWFTLVWIMSPDPDPFIRDVNKTLKISRRSFKPFLKNDSWAVPSEPLTEIESMKVSLNHPLHPNGPSAGYCTWGEFMITNLQSAKLSYKRYHTQAESNRLFLCWSTVNTYATNSERLLR